jgi:hypothetical protein
MSIMSKLLNQWRKPTGRVGRLLAWVLNISHSKRPFSDDVFDLVTAVDSHSLSLHFDHESNF